MISEALEMRALYKKSSLHWDSCRYKFQSYCGLSLLFLYSGLERLWWLFDVLFWEISKYSDQCVKWDTWKKGYSQVFHIQHCLDYIATRYGLLVQYIASFRTEKYQVSLVNVASLRAGKQIFLFNITG